MKILGALGRVSMGKQPVADGIKLLLMLESDPSTCVGCHVPGCPGKLSFAKVTARAVEGGSPDFKCFSLALMRNKAAREAQAGAGPAKKRKEVQGLFGLRAESWAVGKDPLC